MKQIESFAIVAGFIIAAAGVIFFDVHVKRRFDYRFFSPASFLLAAIAFAVIVLGLYLRTRSGAHGSFRRQGAYVAWFGVLIYAKIVVINFFRTSLVIGLAGSIIQLLTFLTAAAIGILPALMTLPMLPVYYLCRNPGGAYTPSPEIIYRFRNW